MKYIYGLQKKSLLFLSSPITGEYSVLEEIHENMDPSLLGCWRRKLSPLANRYSV